MSPQQPFNMRLRRATFLYLQTYSNLNSRQSIRTSMNVLIDAFGIYGRLDRITRQDLLLLKTDIDNSNYAVTTKALHWQRLGTFFEWCHANNHIERNPYPFYTGDKITPLYDTSHHWQRLINTTDTVRNVAILHIMALGVNAAEIARLTRPDVHCNTSTITITNGYNNTRIIALPDEAMTALCAYLADRPASTTDKLFLHSQGSLSAAAIRAIVHRLRATLPAATNADNITKLRPLATA